MRRRIALLAALFVFLWAAPARADNRVIVRSTLGGNGLLSLLNAQLLCGVPLLNQACTVVPLDGPLGQLFLVTTPLDPTIFLGILRPLPGIVDAELDQLISLIGGLNQGPSPPPATLMSDRTPVPYFGTMVWNSYANQPAATIVQVQKAQIQFNVSGVGGVVADIDTGVDPNHPVLAGVLLPGYDFTRNQPGASELNDLTQSDFPVYPPPACSTTNCPSPATVNQSSAAILDQSSAAILDQNVKYAAFGHGTMVMGVIHLVAPNAKLLPLKAFHSDGTGYLSDILHAIYYAVQNQPKANVINMSFDFTSYSAELASALNYASQSALICATSAGNDGQKEIVYPAALQSVAMGVASTNDMDVRSSFSNYGDAIVWVAAPGESIVTTYPFNSYAAGWGTSFSAPFVSGSSALLLNKQAQTNEPQAAAAVAHAAPVGADMGNGRLDIVQALGAISPADFSLSSNPTTSTINAGQSATYTLTVTPRSGFNQAVALNCSGLPAASTCVITPASVTLVGTTPATATVTVQTTVRAVLPPAAPVLRIIDPLPWDVLARLGWLLAWVTWLLVWTTRGRLGQTSRQRPDVAVAAGLLAVSFCFYSCGGIVSSSSSSPSGSAALSSLTLNQNSVNGGSPSTGSVTLSAQAPSGGAIVSLSSSNTTVATVPASVTVPGGTTSATFAVTTLAVTASTSVTISASYAGVTQTALLTVKTQPTSGPTLTSLTLNPTGVHGGSPSTGSVALSAPAPSGGAVVSLSSNNTAIATVPASVTVPAGATSAAFTVTTLAVTASTTVTISASYGVTQTASLNVTPQPPPGPTLTSLTLNPSSVSGGSPSTGSVALSAPAPSGGVLVSFSSSNTTVVAVPASVTIPAGATSAIFNVTTLTVTASTSVNISASYAGVSHTAPLTVTPAPPPGTAAGTYTLTITGTSGNLSHNTTVTLVVK